jgi:asparagine synthase (glutamine-hydrolysing)
MGFQAGMLHFDRAPVTDEDCAVVASWARWDSQPVQIQRVGNLVMAQTVPKPSRERDDGPCKPRRSLCTTFDGRIDNRPDLLRERRHAESGHASDEEIVAALYDARGFEGLADLVGDYSLAIWDEGARAVVLASDFAGVRPLYYSVSGHRAVWASRLGPLVDWLKIDDLDDIYIAGFLSIGGCPNRTPYRGIYSVPPAHVVEISVGGTSIRRFWKLPTGQCIRYRTDSEYEEHLRWIFRDAVHVRMPAEEKWLCELSGGFDSSTVVAVAADLVQRGEVLATPPVSLSFEHEGSLDRKYYLAVAEH